MSKSALRPDGLLLILGALFLGVTLALALTSSRQVRLAKEFASRGQTAVGTVTWVRVPEKSRAVTVAYAYTVDGHAYTGRSLPEGKAFEGLKTGRTLPIRYLPESPSISSPVEVRLDREGNSNKRQIPLTLLVAAISIGAGVWTRGTAAREP